MIKDESFLWLTGATGYIFFLVILMIVSSPEYHHKHQLPLKQSQHLSCECHMHNNL